MSRALVGRARLRMPSDRRRPPVDDLVARGRPRAGRSARAPARAVTAAGRYARRDTAPRRARPRVRAVPRSFELRGIHGRSASRAPHEILGGPAWRGAARATPGPAAGWPAALVAPWTCMASSSRREWPSSTAPCGLSTTPGARPAAVAGPAAAGPSRLPERPASEAGIARPGRTQESVKCLHVRQLRHRCPHARLWYNSEAWLTQLSSHARACALAAATSIRMPSASSTACTPRASRPISSGAAYATCSSHRRPKDFDIGTQRASASGQAALPQLLDHRPPLPARPRASSAPRSSRSRRSAGR